MPCSSVGACRWLFCDIGFTIAVFCFLPCCAQKIGVAEELHDGRVLEVYNYAVEVLRLEACA
jgi:hypothetical protein